MRHVFIINPYAGKRDQTSRIYGMADHLRDGMYLYQQSRMKTDMRSVISSFLAPNS